MKCVNCNAENPDGKTFCGDCGAPLDPLQANIKQYVDAAIIHQLDRRMTDQRVVEAEITEKIAGKLMSWARMLGFFIGIPATFALALLGFFGIQTYSDISSRINLFSARITDLTARAQEDARNLEIQIVTTGTLAQELQDEAKKLETQLAETKALADEVRTLNTRVGTIEKNLKFESSPALTSELQEELESYIYSYHAHLQELGFKLDGDWVKVYIDPNMLNEDHAYYDLEGNRIVFGSSVAKDKDVVLREYTHHVLTSLTANRPYSSNPQFRAIESGLADYFPCSFQNDPVFGETIAPLFRELYKGRFDKTYIRNLNNDRTFSETSSTTPHQDVGEIWGGAFWEMRKLFGQDITDRLLFSTWREMQGQEDSSLSDYGMSFVEKLQVVSQSMGAGNRTGEIKSLFQDRMLGS